MISSTSMTDKEGIDWIYLSPHLDDVALSCGGLVWEQAQAGARVSIWTICAGDPPAAQLSPFAEALHQRWQTGAEAAPARRQEDIHSCQRLGASFRHFPLPDCIYRRAPGEHRYLYDSEAKLFGPLHPDELPLVDELSNEIASLLPEEAKLVAPIALGGHVDHRLTRLAIERLASKDRLLANDLLPTKFLYYPDYPYVLNSQLELYQLQQAGWTPTVHQISREGVIAWQEAVAAHASQISTFWPDLEAMDEAIQAYEREMGGSQLWSWNRL